MDDPFTFDTTNETCIVCGQPTSGGRCFSHILYRDRMVALCCPLCLETFQKNPEFYDIVRTAAKALKPKESHPE
jgi:hypothetical protein